MRKMHYRPQLEVLEDRLAPASVTYTDIDGDNVKITTSIGPLDVADLTVVGGQLRSLDLTDAGFQGASVTFLVTKAATGDGLAAVGRIDATGRDLGNVTVKGDLGVIDCGDGDPAAPALKTLSVRSMGRYGLASQGGAGDLVSDIIGRLASLKVSGDIKDAFVNVADGADGTIGLITIGGSLLGGADSGRIQSSGAMGVVTIGLDLIGGDGANSGAINSLGKLTSVAVGGSLLGGAGAGSGQITSAGDMGAVTIGRAVGGGVGDNSGSISSSAKLAGVTIGGSLLGGAGPGSGRLSSTGDMGAVKIGRDIIGRGGSNSGSISSSAKLAGVTIGGSLVGGASVQSGLITSTGDMGAIKVLFDVVGGAGLLSGAINSLGKLGGATIGGSLLGSVAQATGIIASTGDMGIVKVGRDVIGAAGGGAGSISSLAKVAGVTIGGSLVGGAGLASGLIRGVGDIGPVKIVGSVVGDGERSGMIDCGGNLGAVSIGGDLRGGSISATVPNRTQSGFITADRIASVTIGGSIIAGIDSSTSGDLFKNASINAVIDIGPITVKGSVIGNATPDGVTTVSFSAGGHPTPVPGVTSDVAIKSVKIGGRVEFAQVLAGFDSTGFLGPSTVNGNASIGAVSVGGDWIASSISAGVRDSSGFGFGDPDDNIINNTGDAIIARIASITIKGVVLGTSAASDHFGLTAQQIGAFKSLGFSAALTAGTDPAIELALITGDVTIREL